MKTFYHLAHRFKSSLLEITTEKSLDISDEYICLNTQKKVLENITFRVATGKKSYDIIRFFEYVGHFYSQRIIDVLSKFIDMSDKCYPIKIKDVDMQYYVLYNLSYVPNVNRKENNFLEEPTFIYTQKMSDPIFCIKNTGWLFVTEEVKDALFDNKITNISLEECFSCSRDGYERIKKTGIWPEVRVYEDRQKNMITTKHHNKL